jgi:hypothetical protein
MLALVPLLLNEGQGGVSIPQEPALAASEGRMP